MLLILYLVAGNYITQVFERHFLQNCLSHTVICILSCILVYLYVLSKKFSYYAQRTHSINMEIEFLKIIQLNTHYIFRFSFDIIAGRVV